MRNKISIKEKVWIWPGVAGWHFVNVPREIYEKIRNGGPKKRVGFVPIMAKLGKTSWKTSLFPHTKDQTYLLAIKKSVRKKESVLSGDILKITFNIL